MLALLPASAAADTVTEIIVKRDPGLSGAERRAVRADADVRLVDELPLPRTEVVAARPGDVLDALRDLNADPDVAYAELNRPIHAADVETEDLWGLERLRLFEPVEGSDDVSDLGWALSTGLGRTVAVVDSGVDDSHPDLEDRVVPGYDFVDGDADADDPDGHGTHVAGTIAAERDGVGVAGVAHQARILPLRVLDTDGSGLVSDFIQAIDFAAAQGVRIVNASLSGVGALDSEREAIEAHPEVLFVVAAGNSGTDNDTSPFAEYPCSYELPNVLCVGASNEDDERAVFSPDFASNFGETTVDVFAPGVGIRSTVPIADEEDEEEEQGYADLSGTSMATPHVAGTAALLLSQTPELTPEDVIDAVVGTAVTNPELDGLSVSDGRTDAYRALTENDADGDGVADGDDNCPVVSNPGQEDVCQPVGDDRDGDGFTDGSDDCPDEPAPYSGDGCPGVGPDPDGDGDGVLDYFDNCDDDANPNQADADGDGVGDACDPTPRGPDPDGDGVGAMDDNCLTVPNPSQADADGDGKGNACDSTPRGPDPDGDGVGAMDDNCPTVPNANQADKDRDGVGDACDWDLDGDGRANVGADNCPTVYNPSQANTDGDAYGDACDPTPWGHDADGDGKPSAFDTCPTVYGTLANGCPATVPAPQAAEVASVSATGKKRGRKRSARVVVRTTGAANVRITIERKRGRRWVRVTRRTRTTSSDRVALTVKRLKRGRHRVRISISSAAGRGSSVTKGFRVR